MSELSYTQEGADDDRNVELAKRIEAGMFAGEAIDDPGKFEQLLGRHASAICAELDVPMAENDEDEASRMAEIRNKLYGELVLLNWEGVKATQEFIEGNYGLVAFFAKMRPSRKVEFMDIVSMGVPGLIRAVQGFDYKRGYKFSTYAKYWILSAGIDKTLPYYEYEVPLPRLKHEHAMAIVKTRRRLLQDLGRMPTDEELAEATGTVQKIIMTPELVHTLMGYYDRRYTSLNREVDDDGRVRELGDILKDPNALELDELAIKRIEQRRLIQEMFSILSEEEARVIITRFSSNDDKPIKIVTIAKELGITTSRASQALSSGLAKLRKKYSGIDALKELLD